MNKEIKLNELENKGIFKDGMTIMVGGFMCNGQALTIMDFIHEKNYKDLTIICNDAGFEGKGIGKLIENNQVKKLIATHIGLNPIAGKLMGEEKMEVELIPQGTLIEQIHAGGAGLGGVLTPTGIGTTVEEGKEIIKVDGKEYLLEKALRADLSIIKANKSDRFGNLQYYGTTQNFNLKMAFAADTVIAETDELVEIGEIDPNFVHTAGVVVDYVLKGGRS